MVRLHCTSAHSLLALRMGSLVTTPLAFNSDTDTGKGWCDREAQQDAAVRGGIRRWPDETHE